MDFFLAAIASNCFFSYTVYILFGIFSFIHYPECINMYHIHTHCKNVFLIFYVLQFSFFHKIPILFVADIHRSNLLLLQITEFYFSFYVDSELHLW